MIDVLEPELLELELLELVEVVELVRLIVDEAVELELLDVKLLGVVARGEVVVEPDAGVVDVLMVEPLVELFELARQPPEPQIAPIVVTPTTVITAKVTANFQYDFVLVDSMFLITLVAVSKQLEMVCWVN